MSFDAGYIQRVVQTHTEKRDDLGAFRLPTKETVLAAELVVQILGEIPYEGTMAVCTVELVNRKTYKTKFVVSFSGYHPLLWITPRPANERLAQVLREHSTEGLKEPRFVITNELDKTYFPLHQTSQEFLTRSLRADILSNPLAGWEFRDAIFEFWGMFQGLTVKRGERPVGPFSFEYRKNLSVKPILQKL